GEALGCFGLTEPDHGSDPGSMKTRALKKGNEYVLNGTKLWITNGSVADVAVGWAKGGDGEIGGGPGEAGAPRVVPPPTQGEVFHAGFHHVRARVRRLQDPTREQAAGSEGAQGPALVLEPGALRHRVGRHRRRDGVLRLGAPVRADPYPVREAHRLLPTRPAEARVDDHRDHQGAAPMPAPGPAEGRGPRARAADLDGQDEQRPDGARHRASGP